MKKIIFILITLLLLTACGGPELPDVPMPDSPPNPDLLQPTSLPPTE